MKGVSTVISSVMILAVAVSIATLYAGWLPQFAEGSIGEAANQSNHQIKCSNAAISVNRAEYDRSGNVLQLTLENTGTIRFTRDITVGALNSSNELGRLTVQQLEVSEEIKIDLETDKIPGTVLVTSQKCPQINVVEEEITVVD